MKKYAYLIVLTLSFVFIIACSSDEFSIVTNENNQQENQNSNNTDTSCTTDQVLNFNRGECNITLPFTNQFSESVTGNTRTITANGIPDHMVGLFGEGRGSLNPNAITEQNETYTITANPQKAASLTSLTNTETGRLGPQYSFGVLLNGVELDPVAAEPFPHEGTMSPNVNWEWNLEAPNVLIGLDCNNAHVQASGKYHYHSSPNLYIESLNIDGSAMKLIGYAADGFPIYFKYAHQIAGDNTSTVVEMTSSYRLKSGNRPGDGVTAPCDVYNGIYSNDYEYVEGLGTLDEANGREGVTPEYPSGTYYYVVTDAFPSIPRFFVGTPSNSFRIGG